MQPAQPTTVGKRACLWAYDFVLDLAELEYRLESLKARGPKGTTGTQASFLELFEGDHDKVRKLEQLVCEKIGFRASYAVTGQTYSRKIDSQVIGVLSGIAQERSQKRQPICVSFPIARNWKSPLRLPRSGPRPCRTNGTPCAASGSVRWRAT